MSKIYIITCMLFVKILPCTHFWTPAIFYPNCRNIHHTEYNREHFQYTLYHIDHICNLQLQVNKHKLQFAYYIVLFLLQDDYIHILQNKSSCFVIEKQLREHHLLKHCIFGSPQKVGIHSLHCLPPKPGLHSH